MPEYLPTILIIAVLAVICFIAVLSIIKRANKGCCGAGGGDIEERIEKDTSGFTHRYSVKIGGMHCEKCSSRIAAAFNRHLSGGCHEDLGCRVRGRRGVRH